jgi:hypothetical protein
MANNTNIMKLFGVFMWPSLHTLDTQFHPKWTVDVLLKGDDLKKAKDAQLRIKHKEAYAGQYDGYTGEYLRITRELIKADGSEQVPPKVVDGDLRKMGDDSNIASGSEGNVRFMVKDRDPSAITKYGGYGAYLLEAQVTKHVRFERDSDPEIDFIATGTGGGSAATFDDQKGDDIPF